MKRPRLPFGRAPVEEEVDDEITFHLEMTARSLIQQGMTPNQARAEAQRRFGNLESVRTDSVRFGRERDARERRAELRDELRQDVTFSLRQLAKSRAFTAVSVLTLALGIGATASVFSALDAVVLRALPFENPERIVEVQATRRGDPATPSAAEFVAFHDVKAFSRVAATVLQAGLTMKLADVPEIIASGKVTSEYFDVFGASPLVGRTFTTEEDAPGGAKVAVLSHRLWIDRFNGDRRIVGRQLLLDGVSHTIVGVMPASFDFRRGSEDIWTPLALRPEQLAQFNERFLRVFARLAPGVSIEQARAAAAIAERNVAERWPDRVRPVTEFGAQVAPFTDQLIGEYDTLLLILLGAVGFVLLIACTNVANLLLARGTARAKELAIRAALGAGRARLLRQLLTESLVLALLGAALGLGIAFALQRAIVATSPESVPRLDQVRIDWRVLAFTLGVSVVSCVLFGLVPAARAVRAQLQGVLREGGRSSGAGSRDRLRAVLVAAEVALAITLLVGAGLLLRSAWKLQRVNPGFDPRGVLAARIILPEARYSSAETITRAYAALRDNAARIAGVKSAALASMIPLTGSTANASVRTAEQEVSADRPVAQFRLVSSGYFETMGIRLVAGRDVSTRDGAASPPVVVINEALARLLWPSLSPREVLGRRVDALSPRRAEPHYMEVVGVVANVKESGLEQADEPLLYTPFEQAPALLWPLLQRSLVLVVRSVNPSTDPAVLTRPLRGAVASFDSSLPIADARPMPGVLETSLATARMNTLLLSLLGGIAFVLATVGIYGVVSYFVTQRTHEIGVRMALGASPGRVWKFVVGRALTPMALGFGVGVPLSLVTTKVIEGQLYGVNGHDPATLSSVAVLLLVVGVLAAYVPARRAMRVPPVVALNEA